MAIDELAEPTRPFSEWNEFSKRIFVNAYNRKMRYIWAKAENEMEADILPNDRVIEEDEDN